MDETLRKEIFREELKRRNRGKKIIPSKYRMKYPDSAEREYLRLVNSYMAIEKEVLLKHIPKLKRIINEGSRQLNTDSQKDNEKERKKTRLADMASTAYKIDRIFEDIDDELDKLLRESFGLFKLRSEIQKIANLNHKLTIAEWKKAVSKTLGINILDDYYSGEFYQRMLEQWISANVDLIKTIPKDSLGKMKEMVYSDYMNGRTTTNIVKDLQQQYGIDKRHARLIARDQTSKLNAKITQSQQRDAGVDKYKWSTVGDGRVRDSHDILDGETCSWDDPPETDDGRKCHPGEDYQCRCCAIPVFDIDTLDLPV